MSSSSYTPDESQSTILQEEMWLNGAFLGNFLLGIETTLFVLAFLAVLRRTIKHSRMRIFLLVYIAVLFLITVAAYELTLGRIRMGFITQRNYPGGPAAFLNDERSLAFTILPNIFVVSASWMMDSLLVWRCHLVCSTGERLWWVGFAIPLLLLIGVFVVGSLVLRDTVHTIPSVGYTYASVYGVTSLALNLTATGFIAARLLVHRHRIVSQLGRAHGQHYMGITTVIIQSAAVYTGLLVVFIVAEMTQSPGIIILQQIMVQVQTIASFFIIWQLARGQGWTRSSDTEVVSAAVSSLNTRVRPSSQPNVIQLEALSTGQDDVEEGSIRPTKTESKDSFHKGVEV